MSVTFSDDGSSFEIGDSKTRILDLHRIAQNWTNHRSGDPLTDFVNDFASSFLDEDIPQHKALLFVRLVCAWGGLRGGNFQLFRLSVAELEAKGTSLSCILKESKDDSIAGNYSKAIKAFDGTKGLGVSFRSKVLRFLCPNHAAVLDSHIRKQLGYSNSANGYELFVNDCIAVRDCLNRSSLRPDDLPVWNTTAVEMGIFLSVKDQS